jgi:hypothetical protein
MNISIRNIAILALTAGSMLLATCKKSNNDTTQSITCAGTVTYAVTAKAIIDKNCTSSGCHNAGSSRGDFTSYAGIKPYLNSGDFYKEVITTKAMPKGSSLSTDDYNALYCWSKNNYAE